MWYKSRSALWICRLVDLHSLRLRRQHSKSLRITAHPKTTFQILKSNNPHGIFLSNKHRFAYCFGTMYSWEAAKSILRLCSLCIIGGLPGVVSVYLFRIRQRQHFVVPQCAFLLPFSMEIMVQIVLMGNCCRLLSFVKELLFHLVKPHEVSPLIYLVIPSAFCVNNSNHWWIYKLHHCTDQVPWVPSILLGKLSAQPFDLYSLLFQISICTHQSHSSCWHFPSLWLSMVVRTIHRLPLPALLLHQQQARTHPCTPSLQATAT